jgi:hypothetical protein
MAKFLSNIPITITGEKGELTYVGQAEVVEKHDSNNVIITVILDSSDGEAIAELIKHGRLVGFDASGIIPTLQEDYEVTIREVIDNSDVDHLVTNQNVDQLVSELSEAFIEKQQHKEKK